MDIFSSILTAIAELPDWVPLILVPAHLLAGAVVFLILKLRRAYLFTAAGLGFLGFFLMCCEGDIAAAFAYAGLYHVLAFALFGFFFLPRRKKRVSREERIYRKFHEDLKEPLPEPAMPPKVCCFESAPVSESGLRLNHVFSLLDKLKKEKLSPTDRLEVEVLSRSVEGCRGRALNAGELDALNDSLASVLKLTAKYKL